MADEVTNPLDIHNQILAQQQAMKNAIIPLAGEIVEVIKGFRESPGYVRLSEIQAMLPPGENITQRLNDIFQVLNMAPIAISQEYAPVIPLHENLTPAAFKTPETP